MIAVMTILPGSICTMQNLLVEASTETRFPPPTKKKKEKEKSGGPVWSIKKKLYKEKEVVRRAHDFSLFLRTLPSAATCLSTTHHASTTWFLICLLSSCSSSIASSSSSFLPSSCSSSSSIFFYHGTLKRTRPVSVWPWTATDLGTETVNLYLRTVKRHYAACKFHVISTKVAMQFASSHSYIKPNLY